MFISLHLGSNILQPLQVGPCARPALDAVQPQSTSAARQRSSNLLELAGAFAVPVSRTGRLPKVLGSGCHIHVVHACVLADRAEDNPKDAQYNFV